MYVAAACHLFQSSDGPLSCCVGLAWLRMIMMCHYGAIVFYVSKIETQQKGRRGVAPTPDETLRTKGFATHLIISDHSVCFIVFCLLYTMFHQIILKSSQVLWFIKYVSYISVLYSVPNATLYHSRGRGSLTSFWCGCSFYVGNVSSLFRFMSHCLHCQKLFKIFFISSFISKAYQKNWKNWKNVVANTSTKPRLSQGTQPVF